MMNGMVCVLGGVAFPPETFQQDVPSLMAGWPGKRNHPRCCWLVIFTFLADCSTQRIIECDKKKKKRTQRLRYVSPSMSLCLSAQCNVKD